MGGWGYCANPQIFPSKPSVWVETIPDNKSNSDCLELGRIGFCEKKLHTLPDCSTTERQILQTANSAVNSQFVGNTGTTQSSTKDWPNNILGGWIISAKEKYSPTQISATYCVHSALCLRSLRLAHEKWKQKQKWCIYIFVQCISKREPLPIHYMLTNIEEKKSIDNIDENPTNQDWSESLLIMYLSCILFEWLKTHSNGPSTLYS